MVHLLFLQSIFNIFICILLRTQLHNNPSLDPRMESQGCLLANFKVISYVNTQINVGEEFSICTALCGQFGQGRRNKMSYS